MSGHVWFFHIKEALFSVRASSSLRILGNRCAIASLALLPPIFYVA